jgi:hypothetical protein
MKFFSKFQKTLGAFSVLVSLLIGSAGAQTSLPSTPAAAPSGPMIYPAKGQTQEQMAKDEADSYAWAKQQSGYDPMAVAPQAQQPVPYSQPAPSQPSGGVVRGGARGAAAGAAVGAIAGNAGKGAAIGAASGGAIGGVRQRRAGEAQQQTAAEQQAAQQQQSAQQQAVDQQKFDAYKRAFAASMEAKGYTVKW